MADRVEPFAVTVPPATGIAVPQITTLAFRDGIVTELDVTVPPGPSGLVGFRIQHLGSQIIPYTGAQFIIADDRELKWPLANFPTASGWQLAAYNLDIYPHTLYLEFLIDEIPMQQSAGIKLIQLGG